MTATHKTISFRWILATLFGCLFLCCSGGIATIFISKRTAEHRLNDTIKRLEAKGLPTDDASIENLHKQLSSTRDAEAWASVLSTLGSEQFSRELRSIPDSPIRGIPVDQPWDEQAAFEQLLKKYDQPLRQLIDLAQDNEAVLLPIKFQLAQTLLPYAQYARSSANAVRFEAILAARASDSDREFRAINAILGCSMALRGEPTVVSQLVSMAIHEMAIEQLKQAVESNRLKPEHLEVLRSRLSQFDIAQCYQHPLTGELLNINLLRNMDDDSVSTPARNFLGFILSATGTADDRSCKFAESIEQLREIDPSDLKTFSESIHQIEVSWEAESSSILGSTHQKLLYPYFAMLTTFPNLLIKQEMMNDIAILGIAIRQYHNKFGTLPSTIGELEKVGIDIEQFKTVSGEPPRYELSTSRATLWSFNPQKSATNANPSLPDSPPNKPAISGPNDFFWWSWEFVP